MDYFLFLASITGFFFLAPLLALVRVFHRSRFPVLLAFAIAALGGWVLSNSAVHFYYEHLDEMMKWYKDPPEALVDEWTADGAKQVFAWLFGWIYGLIYAAPWLVVAEFLAVHFEGKNVPVSSRRPNRANRKPAQG